MLLKTQKTCIKVNTQYTYKNFQTRQRTAKKYFDEETTIID